MYTYIYTGAHIKSFGLCRGNIAFCFYCPAPMANVRRGSLGLMAAWHAPSPHPRRPPYGNSHRREPPPGGFYTARPFSDRSRSPYPRLFREAKTNLRRKQRRACELGVRSNGARAAAENGAPYLYVHVQGSLS